MMDWTCSQKISFSSSSVVLVGAYHCRMVTFLPFELNGAVRIHGDTGSQDSSARVASGVNSSATPCMWGCPSSCPE